MRDYSDIVGLSRPRSLRPPMPLSDRAAQFAPFAALSGHGAAVAEAARFTEERPVLSDDQRDGIDRALAEIRDRMGEGPFAKAVRFVPDERKAGGSLRTVRGRVRAVDEYRPSLVLDDGSEISLADVVALEVDDAPEGDGSEAPGS